MNQPETSTSSKPIEIVPGGSLADILKLHTGEANKEAPHLTVPFYMPLAQPMTFEDGLTCISPALRKKTRSGAITLVAVAHGHMAPPGEELAQVQFVLFFDTDKDAPGLESGIQTVWPSWVFTSGGKLQEHVPIPTRVALQL